ncbi:MAG TPA: amino acid adenylation domain-containing protein [Burkholderiales bacterium]|nr:amino acid adenylation domain-containing protein [Burkholderiales bacterium]
MSWNLAAPVLAQRHRTPDHLALYADGVNLTYAELVQRAQRFAGALHAHGIGPKRRVAILGSRSLAAVEAVLGVAWAGAAYVPLGLRWPEVRLQSAIALARPDAIIADERGAQLLTPQLLASVSLVVVPRRESIDAAIPASGTRVLALDALSDATVLDEPALLSGDELAYIIFTSGTTGVPKGVMATMRSVSAYLNALGSLKALTSADRASQFTELTFDPSVGEIFLPWAVGASLHVVPPVSNVSPARFIRERELTIWGSAPAAIAWMRDTRSLQAGSLPGLRYTSFGGEPLSLAAVRAWQAAAPNSVIDNLYGPTEATVDCVGQRITPGQTPVVTPGRDILAIGTPHPGTALAVFDANHRLLPAGERGELAIAGDQLTLGYLDAPKVTAERFPVIGGKRWYLTGDIAMRDACGMYHHFGRMDNQIKLHGHRVELEEIEAHTREVTSSDQVAAIAWPMREGVAQGIVCFVVQSAVAVSRVRELLRLRLPAYMVPNAIREVHALPLNANGKLDRHALIALLVSETPDTHAKPNP